MSRHHDDHGLSCNHHQNHHSRDLTMIIDCHTTMTITIIVMIVTAIPIVVVVVSMLAAGHPRFHDDDSTCRLSKLFMAWRDQSGEARQPTAHLMPFDDNDSDCSLSTNFHRDALIVSMDSKRARYIYMRPCLSVHKHTCISFPLFFSSSFCLPSFLDSQLYT